MFGRLKRRVRRTVHRLRNPVTPAETRRALREVAGDGADLLFVHSSLSSLGRFTAGPQDVLDALGEFSGTLGLPTHTYTYPETLGATAAVFDAATTPSQTGALTELFRKRSGVSRSIHSTHSLAMCGPMTAELTAGHYLNETPCGVGSPYARMIERGASALMWGVDFEFYTFFHTAEDASGSELAYEPDVRDHFRVRDEAGVVQDRFSKRQSRSPRRFADCGDLMEKVGLVRRAPLGAGHLLFVRDCAAAHDFLVERLRRFPDFLQTRCSAPLA